MDFAARANGSLSNSAHCRSIQFGNLYLEEAGMPLLCEGYCGQCAGFLRPPPPLSVISPVPLSGAISSELLTYHDSHDINKGEICFMSTKRGIRTLLLVIMVLLGFIVPAYAITAVQMTDVPTHSISALHIIFVKQEKTQWCWATTAQMTGKCVYPSSNVTQTQIVVHVKGEDINDAANPRETANGTMYATNDTTSFLGDLGAMSFRLVKNHIDKGRPIQPLVNNGVTGHYYVIYGYDEASNGDYLYIADPWDGYGKYVSYLDFLNGTWSDTRPWIATVK